MKRILPKYRLKEIKKLLPTMTYRDIAEKLGCGVTVIAYYSRKLGLNKTRPRGHFKTAKALTAKYWATHTAREIAEMVGCNPANITHYKNLLGLTRTKEQEEAIKKRRYEKMVAKFKKNHARDKRRIIFGLEPISKVYLSLAPRHILQVGYNLHRKYGYEYTDDPYVMSRNGHSLEGKKYDESYYINKYGFKFID
ncbi:MAG: hypothetical protein LUC37_01905 [Prevotella sp.]|nr:hypothetical protein [Prevotella sp.]